MLSKFNTRNFIFNFLLLTSMGVGIISCNKKSNHHHEKSLAEVDTNRFKIELLASGMPDPTEIAVSPKGDVFILERKGKVNLYLSKEKKTIVLGQLKVNLGHEDGLLGIALDPNFLLTNWIYLLYTPDPHREQRISRFTIKNNQLDLNSEKIVLAFPIVPERHQGGSLAFDKFRNLLISTGENTKPTDINGHAPIDERKGHEINDSQRSAGNTNDLRGKILRIHPLADGSYTIPKGNLFPINTPLTRPEIYIMGCRNPFRITVDAKTNTLYWGDIGPDAGEDTEKGPRGYDEINKTDKAGNFGWPYFIANNKSYSKVEPNTGKIIETFDPAAPQNNSPNNTGLKNLPLAQPAWIWYPYDASKEFPMMGVGGRTAIAGGIYRYNSKNKEGFPQAFEGKLFIADWMRNFVKMVGQDEKGKINSITPFLNSYAFKRPIDLQFGNDGCLYILEYGSNWFDNNDSRLLKISYQRSNIAPLVNLSASQNQGAAPLKVKFSSQGTFDADGDELIYEWRFDEGKKIQSRDKNPEFQFEKPGIYQASLTVTDSKGNVCTQTTTINVGNTPPELSITYPNHGSFYWSGDLINYQVSAKDKEDGRLDATNINIQTSSFFEGDKKNQPYGEKLIQESDCKSCHQLEAKSVGPSFMTLSHKYAGADDAGVQRLANKIIQGGSGVWGTYVMSAHPQLGIEEAKEMVKFILSVSSQQNTKSKSLPLSGDFAIPTGEINPNMAYGIRATVQDKGNQGQAPIVVQKTKILKPAIIQAKNYDWCKDIINSGDYARMPFPTSGVGFYELDLKNVNNISIVYNYDFYYPNCFLECRLDSPTGKLIGKVELQKKKVESKDEEIKFPIIASSGLRKVYFTYHPDLKIHAPLNLKTIKFHK